MSAARGTPARPPADLSSRDLTGLRVSVAGEFLRISHEKAPLLDWSNSDGARFSGPGLPCAVLYVAENKETCFWERFGEEIRDQPLEKRGVSEKILGERVWKSVTIAPGSAAQCLDLRDAETLRRIGADGATFFATYDVTQAWAEALMHHPAGIEGLIYTSRLNTPETCVALFGRPRFLAVPTPVSAAVLPVRPLDDPGLLTLFARERIALLT